MDTLGTIALLAGALVMGALVGWLAASGKLAAAREEIARLRAQEEAERRAGEEKLAVVRQAEQALKDAFQALSAEALRQNNQAFLDLASTKLGEVNQVAAAELESRKQAIQELVRPIEEGIKKVDLVLGDIEKQRIGAYEAIRQQMESMTVSQEKLKQETANLVKALRTPQGRGRWGEIQLRRVVEMAGMVGYCDFFEQESVDTSDGQLRPDMIIRLPGGKQIIVDAKTPLQAYLEAAEAQDDGVREAQLLMHARQVRDHISKLGTKTYWSQFEATPDFVFMFLPGEPIYHAALQADPSLIEHGVNQKVIPASPVTLIALLRAVSYGWRQEQMAENAKEIAANGAELYKRLRVLAGHISKIGTNLRKAVESYNSSVGSIEGSVLPGARRFKDLGVGVHEEIEALEEIEITTREIRSPELLGNGGALPPGNGVEGTDRE
jgi:DNA recombination protein RmuC